MCTWGVCVYVCVCVRARNYAAHANAQRTLELQGYIDYCLCRALTYLGYINN